MTTIHFNTSRLYQNHGQRITVHVQGDGTVLFMDHSRMIGGKLNSNHHPITNEARYLADWMIVQYDLHLYTPSVEALSLAYNHAEEHLFRM